MPDPLPAYAVVEILIHPDRLSELKAIPNLKVQVRPMYTDDPTVVRMYALADQGAQQAALALGATVTVVKSAADYARQIESAYRSLGKDPNAETR